MWHKCDASFSEGFAQVRKDFKYGYIDKSGKLVMRILFYGTGSRYKIILCSLNTANTNDVNDSPSATLLFHPVPNHTIIKHLTYSGLISTSTDGITWTSSTSGTSIQLTGVDYKE